MSLRPGCPPESGTPGPARVLVQEATALKALLPLSPTACPPFIFRGVGAAAQPRPWTPQSASLSPSLAPVTLCPRRPAPWSGGRVFLADTCPGRPLQAGPRPAPAGGAWTSVNAWCRWSWTKLWTLTLESHTVFACREIFFSR